MKNEWQPGMDASLARLKIEVALVKDGMHPAEAQTMIAEFECATSRDEWRTMDSAPTDGSSFQVYLLEPLLGSHVHTWSNRNERHSGSIGGIMAFDAPTPTHWMPLPDPPEDGRGTVPVMRDKESDDN